MERLDAPKMDPCWQKGSNAESEQVSKQGGFVVR